MSQISLDISNLETEDRVKTKHGHWIRFQRNEKDLEVTEQIDWLVARGYPIKSIKAVMKQVISQIYEEKSSKSSKK